MSAYVPAALRRRIHTWFGDCCASCRTAERLTATHFEIEHIQPRATGGETAFANLCLSCPICNRYKSDSSTATDPLTNASIPLFHERRCPIGQAKRDESVEEETLELLASAVPESLPKELVDVVKELPFLDDEGLWRAARSHVAAAIAAELESLHFKQQREGLSVTERETMVGLTQQYERALLVRAQAAAILRARGHDVNGLLVQP